MSAKNKNTESEKGIQQEQDDQTGLKILIKPRGQERKLIESEEIKKIKRERQIIYFAVLTDVTKEEIEEYAKKYDMKFSFSKIGNERNIGQEAEDAYRSRMAKLNRMLTALNNMHRKSYPADSLGQTVNSNGRPNKKYASTEFQRRIAESRFELLVYLLNGAYNPFTDNKTVPVTVFYRLKPEEYEVLNSKFTKTYDRIADLHMLQMKAVEEEDPEEFARIMNRGKIRDEADSIEQEMRVLQNGNLDLKAMGYNDKVASGVHGIDPDMITSVFIDRAEDEKKYRQFLAGIRQDQSRIIQQT